MLAALKPDIVLSTKVRVPAERPDIGAAIAASLEASLRRLKRDHVDVFQLHNTIAAGSGGMTMSVEEVLGGAVPALNKAREQGETRHIGFTAIGKTDALHRVIASVLSTARRCPTTRSIRARASRSLRLWRRNYGGVLDLRRRGMASPVGIRALAGGALSGSEARDPLGIVGGAVGSGGSYAADAARARRLEPMVREGPCGEPDRDGDALRHRARQSFHRRDRTCEHREARRRDRCGREGAVVGCRARAARQLQAGFLGEVG